MPQVIGLWAAGSYCRQLDANGDIDPARTQQVMGQRTGGLLVTRTGGEWRDAETNWIIVLCDKIHEALGLPFFRRSARPTYLRYNVQVVLSFLFRGRVRNRLAAGKMPHLEYAKWAREDREQFNSIQHEEAGQARYMRGLPSPRAVKIFSGLLFGFLRPFEDLMKPQAAEILADDPEAVIQWELPVELSFGSIRLYPNWLKRHIFRRFMALFERLVEATPASSRHAFHLCWGDLNLKPYVPVWLRSEAAKVWLINAILAMKCWRHNGGEHVLYAIHDPFCDGRHGPSEDARDRAIYNDMQAFPEDTIYAIGILHPDLSLMRTVYFAQHFASELGNRVTRLALAAPCGDQRKADEEVADQYKKAVKAVQLLQPDPDR